GADRQGHQPHGRPAPLGPGGGGDAERTPTGGEEGPQGSGGAKGDAAADCREEDGATSRVRQGANGRTTQEGGLTGGLGPATAPYPPLVPTAGQQAGRVTSFAVVLPHCRLSIDADDRLAGRG